MFARYPTAGGQYSWVAILAPTRWAKGLSYLCGWFMLIGILCMGAVNNFVATNFILGIAQLNYGFTIERWHTVLVAYLITWVAAASNVFLPHILNKLSKAIFAWNLLSFVICFITILAKNDHKQSASYVFADFQNFTGWNAPFATCLGLLQSAFGKWIYKVPKLKTHLLTVLLCRYVLLRRTIAHDGRDQERPKASSPRHRHVRLHWLLHRLHLARRALLLHRRPRINRLDPNRSPRHRNHLQLPRKRSGDVDTILNDYRHLPIRIKLPHG